MHRLCAVLVLLLGAACAVLGLTAAPAWLLGVPVAVVVATALWLRVGPARLLDALDDGGDAGRGPAGLHP